MCAVGPSESHGARLPGRSGARPGLVREVPAAGWAPGPEEDRAGVGRAGSAAGGLLHEAHGGGVAAGSARPGAPRDAARAWCGRARRSPTRPKSGCGSSSRTASASRRRCRDYRSVLHAHLLPAFGDRCSSRSRPRTSSRGDGRSTGLSNRSKNKLLIQLHGIFRRAQSVRPAANPLASVEKHPLRRAATSRCSRPRRSGRWSGRPRREQDAAIFLTAAFTGLRMGELLALRWRDVDFAGSAIRVRASYCARRS